MKPQPSAWLASPFKELPNTNPYFPPHERGACVMWDDADDIPVLLDQVFLCRNELRIVTRGKVNEYEFDLRAITKEEYQALLEHFRLINFDQSFKMEVR
jgi:hypothetical protein